MPNYNSFPQQKLPSLYRGPRQFDLSESTTRDLYLGELIDLIGLEEVRQIRLDYGTEAAGLLALREAVGARWGVPAATVVTTHGAAFALYLVAAELAEPAGQAIIAAPYFQQAYNTLQAHGWHIDIVQNSFEQNYQLNVAGIVALLDKRTRLVSLASPQNPSGVVIPVTTIATLLEQMAHKAPKAYLLVDETYLEASYSATGLPSAANLSPRVITCASVSKAYGAPGLRVGWLTVADATLRSRFITAKENIVITDSSLNEHLAVGLFSHADIILQKQREHMAAPLQLVKQWQAAEAHRLGWAEPDAGALCCCRLAPAHYSDEQLLGFWQALQANDTFVRPGLKFGSDIRHFRLGFGHVSFDQLEQGLANLTQALDQAEL